MDYGQPVNTDSQLDYFTSGAGTNQVNINNFEPENNLDLTNEQTDWSSPVERSHRDIGNAAINAPDSKANKGYDIAIPKLEEMGQVISMEMPPGREEIVDMTPGQLAEQAISFDKNKIKTKDSLSELGVQEVKQVISKLNQDGNAADFYDAAREMMEVNMENSYGENATWKGGENK